MCRKIETTLAFMLVKKKVNDNEDEKWWKNSIGFSKFSPTFRDQTINIRLGARIHKRLFRLKQNHQLERDFSDALWEWREVKSSTEAYDCSLDKEFRADDSRIATCQISRKLGTDSNWHSANSIMEWNFEVKIWVIWSEILESIKILWKI